MVSSTGTSDESERTMDPDDKTHGDFARGEETEPPNERIGSFAEGEETEPRDERVGRSPRVRRPSRATSARARSPTPPRRTEAQRFSVSTRLVGVTCAPTCVRVVSVTLTRR